MNMLEVLKQYWPFLALALWFGYKWWNSNRVVAMLPEHKKHGYKQVYNIGAWDKLLK